MPDFNFPQNSLIAGEISQKAQGRQDLPQYAHAVKKLENFVVHPQGGAGRRAGSYFIGEAGQPIGQTKVRILPFIFSRTEAYIVEQSPGTYDSNLGIRTIRTSDGFSETVTNFLIYTSVEKNWTANPNTEWFNVAVGDLDQIQYAQSADVLYLVHPDLTPIVLLRKPFGFIAYPYINQDEIISTEYTLRTAFRAPNGKTTHTMTIGGAIAYGNTVSLTSSEPFFDAGHVGAIFQLFSLGGETMVRVSAFTSSTVVDAVVVGAGPPIAGPTDVWRESAWSQYRGFPRSVTIFEDRLYYGGNDSEPDTIWASKIGNFAILAISNPLTHTFSEDDPFSITLTSPQVNDIQWLASGKNLFAGTSSSEFIISADDPTAGISSLRIRSETAQGSAFIQPVRIDNKVLFVDRSSAKVRELAFNFDEDIYRSRDISLLAEHMYKRMLPDRTISSVSDMPKFVNMAYQASENTVLWVQDNLGGLSGVTRDSNENIVAWHYHKIGGFLGGEPPKVVSICVVPSSEGNHDDLIIAVQRTINATTKCYLEKITKDFILDDMDNSLVFGSGSKPVYMDSAIVSQRSPATTSFGGFTHLVGQDVCILIDGQFAGETTVIAGDQYVTNTGAEVDTAGWATFAGGSPYSGGAPAITLTRNTTTPIAGTGDFRITKGAVNASNEGASFSFTIDNEDKAKEHVLSFKYRTTGTYGTGNEIDFLVYDVTNNLVLTFIEDGSFINPIDAGELQSTVGPITVTRRFLTSGNSSSYRIVFIVDGTTATAFDFYFDDVTLTGSGRIVTDHDASEVIGGFCYDSIAELLPIEAGAAIGSAQGAIKRVDRAVVRFDRTVGGKIGESEANMVDIPFRPTTFPPSAAIDPQSVDKVIQLDATWDRQSTVVIKQDKPLPMNIVGIYLRGTTSD